MQEEIVVGKGTEYPLEGRLAIPDGAEKKVPGVVLVQGSGPSDRNETVQANKPFRDIALFLAKRGIASIRYDKRTFVYGKRMVEEGAGNITVEEETIEDALLAAKLLEADPRVDASRVFLLGHSLGGMLAPRIDAEGGNFAGLIILAGSPRTLEEILIDQNEEALAQLGKFLQKIGNKQLAALKAKFDSMKDMTEEEAKQAKLFGKTYLWYFKEMDEHPTEAYLKELQKPVLVLQGEKDFQVSPKKDFALYQKICAGKPNFTFRLYPGLNHLFMPSVYGTIKEFKKEYKVPSHVDAQVLEDIVGWIGEH